jgi:hypothetical protein
MNTLTGWLNKPVIVTLNAPTVTEKEHGTLIEIDEHWLTLQQGQQRLVIYLHNVLYVAFDPE